MSTQANSAPEGDPGKLAYLHNPNWSGTIFSNLPTAARKKSFCGACDRVKHAGSESEREYFSRPDLHDDSEVCDLWRASHPEGS